MIVFLFYFIGVLTGLFLATLIIKRESRIQNFIERFERSIIPKGKAEFFDPGNTEQDALEVLYEENKKKGIDTKIE